MNPNRYKHPIYILRKHTAGIKNTLTSENYALLPYKHQDLVDELKKMVTDNNKTIADLFYFTSDSSLAELMEKDDKFYLEMDKDKFFEELLSNTYPKRFAATMESIKMDKDIVAYPAITEGFYNQIFQIDDDFKVAFSTNINFSWKSYFRVTLLYKDIPILLGPRYPNAQFLSYYAQSDGIFLTCGEPQYNVTLDLKPDFIEFRKAMDAIAMLYNKLTDNMNTSVQAIVLNKEVSKTISANYWGTNILANAK